MRLVENHVFLRKRGMQPIATSLRQCFVETFPYAREGRYRGWEMILSRLLFAPPPNLDKTIFARCERVGCKAHIHHLILGEAVRTYLSCDYPNHLQTTASVGIHHFVQTKTSAFGRPYKTIFHRSMFLNNAVISVIKNIVIWMAKKMDQLIFPAKKSQSTRPCLF